MYLNRMKFDPNPLFDYTDLSLNLGSKSEDLQVFGKSGMISPQDTRQYLYLLTPKIPTDLETRTTPNLGKLDIGWNSAQGQAGKLQTSQLTRKVPTIDPFEISVVHVPPRIEPECPFVIKVRARNNLPDEKQLLSIQGVKSKMSNVLIYGSNEIKLGFIEPQSSLEFEMTFFALLAGVHKVTGLKITEAVGGSSKDVDCLAIVHVE
jgi:trafficking protein particle complex subunit 13